MRWPGSPQPQKLVMEEALVGRLAPAIRVAVKVVRGEPGEYARGAKSAPLYQTNESFELAPIPRLLRRFEGT